MATNHRRQHRPFSALSVVPLANQILLLFFASTDTQPPSAHTRTTLARDKFSSQHHPSQAYLTHKSLATMAPKSIEEAKNRAEQGIQKSWDAMGSLMGLVDDLDSFNQELKQIFESYKNIPIPPGFRQGGHLPKQEPTPPADSREQGSSSQLF
ncbi:uncharacterized protein QC763_0086820 [Podospora pseudopauciseta]|uniref:Uncharacterized protein n=1 Tax=Podospora pseudopauciseta TaxID=2093780 RepID=A0ABR0H905_9PEZI|nr:hypothetical protein QC763_0086820 [Podospora pseudopauciseta]